MRNTRPRRITALILTFLSVTLVSRVSFSQVCPDLSDYYSDDEPDWSQVLDSLSESFTSCLGSSEYFALYGSAQLYSGLLAESVESLERALLLNPDNGAAMIDYGEALYQTGQLFTALEINELLLNRGDIPAELVAEIEARQERWQGITRQTSWRLDLSGGYDDNLNGASDKDSVTLTLSGEPVVLGLSEDFRVIGGPLLNFRVVGSHQRMSLNRQQSFSGEIFTRISESSKSNLAQASGRYILRSPSRSDGWQLSSGLSHLNFSSEPLYTAIDSELRYRFSQSGHCQPYLGVALQHQTWHNQSLLNGIESKLGVGSSCSVPGMQNQSFNVDIGALVNSASKADRLGGNRQGWQFNLSWQVALSRGQLLAQFSHTELDDQNGYSPLLAYYARRNVSRNSAIIQYRRALPALGPGAQFTLNFFHQDQNSNLDLFQTDDTSAEIGISWAF